MAIKYDAILGNKRLSDFSSVQSQQLNSVYSTVDSNSASWAGGGPSGDYVEESTFKTYSGEVASDFSNLSGNIDDNTNRLSGYVTLTTDQTIDGIKTFEPSTKFNSIIPVSSDGVNIYNSGGLAYTPQTSANIINKGYVDPLIEALSGDWSYGDSLELQYSPTNYSTFNNTLSAHLNGIDNSLNSIVTGSVDSPSGVIDSFTKSNRKRCKWEVSFTNVTSGRYSTVMSYWNSNDDIEFNEFGTDSIPLSSSTDNVNLSVEINGNYVNLIAAVPNDDWEYDIERNVR